MARINVIQGDVTTPQTEQQTTIIIPHVVNDLGIMGAGVALALRKKWNAVFKYYYGYILDQTLGLEDEELKSARLALLGKLAAPGVGLIGVEENIFVANMIAQNEVISNVNQRPLRYDALVSCMNLIKDTIQKGRIKYGDVEIHTPKFGSDLAGGNWDFILELIEDIWIQNNINVIVYEF